MSGPSHAAILERARSLCNEARYTVALQFRRLGCVEPEDAQFIFRWWADLQFLVVALRRMRRAAELCSRAAPEVRAAIADFDRALPCLAKMRNVGEHIDAYALDDPKRHDHSIDRKQLQVGTWNGIVFQWLGCELDIGVAVKATESLWEVVAGATTGHRSIMP